MPLRWRSEARRLTVKTSELQRGTMGHAGEKLKWAETLYVTHGPSFGHKVYLATQIQGREPETHMDWAWRGLGIPAEIVQSVAAYAGAVAQEYLVNRYGVALDGDPVKYGDSPTF